MRHYDEQKYQDWLAETQAELKRLGKLESDEGWTRVDYPHGYKSNSHAIDVELWCEEHCGLWDKFGRTYYFKEEKDAALFLLRFS